MNEFQPFPKIPRLNRECVVTEKIDGTNASIWIQDTSIASELPRDESMCIVDNFVIRAGSRNRFLQPSKEKDNFGFARWVQDNASELVKLGHGVHYGEWWGSKIQRGYDLKEKKFSLFNVARWTTLKSMTEIVKDVPTDVVDVVPVLYQGAFNTTLVNMIVDQLGTVGSIAAPGYMKPEGVIVYHTKANSMFKVTCEDDHKPKGQ